MAVLTHGQIWQAIDGLAQHHGTTPSGLARLAGLDPTTFNKSKRAAGGKLRWPSTESIAKALAAVGASLDEFVVLVEAGSARQATMRLIPLIGMAQAGERGAFNDAGHPTGAGWEQIGFPDLRDEHAYALEIAGDALLPVYRDGDRIVASPASGVRRGDRVVVRAVDGEMMIRRLGRMTAQRVELKSLDPDAAADVLPPREIAFLHRIVWASQ